MQHSVSTSRLKTVDTHRSTQRKGEKEQERDQKRRVTDSNLPSALSIASFFPPSVPDERLPRRGREIHSFDSSLPWTTTYLECKRERAWHARLSHVRGKRFAMQQERRKRRLLVGRKKGKRTKELVRVERGRRGREDFSFFFRGTCFFLSHTLSLLSFFSLLKLTPPSRKSQAKGRCCCCFEAKVRERKLLDLGFWSCAFFFFDRCCCCLWSPHPIFSRSPLL